MIRVGRTIYDKGGNRSDPSFENFTPIVVLMNSHSKYGSLGPYILKDNKGRIFENIWQFSKIYKDVPATVCRYSRWNNMIIWNHPAEIHIDAKNETTPKYWAWRKKGKYCKYAIRYPVGFNHRHKCVGTVHNGNVIDYIEARKQLYTPLYIELVSKQQVFKELKKRLNNGENLLIIEVDGPHQEDLDYYREKYNVSKKFIENNTVLATKENLSILINDSKYPFGHGYCLAMALLDMAVEDLEM